MISRKESVEFGEVIGRTMVDSIGADEFRIMLDVLSKNDLKPNVEQQIMNLLLLIKLEYGDEISKVKTAKKEKKRERIEFFLTALKELGAREERMKKSYLEMFNQIKNGTFSNSQRKSRNIFSINEEYFALLEHKIVKTGWFKTKICKGITEEDVIRVVQDKIEKRKNAIIKNLNDLGIDVE